MTTPTEGTQTTGSLSPHSERMAFSVKEAADLLGISHSLAYELVTDGTLPSLRLRRRIVVPRVALLRMLDGEQSGETTAAPTPRPDGSTAGLASELDSDRSAREWVAALLDVGRATTDGSWSCECLQAGRSVRRENSGDCFRFAAVGVRTHSGHEIGSTTTSFRVWS
jgi:excisionase family DNA binding protein